MKNLTQTELEAWIKSLIKEGNIHAFYVSKVWLRVKKEVLLEQHFECQICKAKGKYKKATTVHHRFYVRKFPRLALSKEFNGERNLVAICDECHYDEHHRGKKKEGSFVNAERW